MATAATVLGPKHGLGAHEPSSTALRVKASARFICLSDFVCRTQKSFGRKLVKGIWSGDASIDGAAAVIISLLTVQRLRMATMMIVLRVGCDLHGRHSHTNRSRYTFIHSLILFARK